MRTAEEILRGKDQFSEMDLSNLKLWQPLIDKINEARKEAIEECAEKFYTEIYSYYGERKTAQLKQSILNIINELK